MKKIVLSNDNAFIYLSRSFYRKELIIETINIYHEFFNASLAELGKYFVLKITSTDKTHSNEELANEFLNYLIAQEYEHLSVK